LTPERREEKVKRYEGLFILNLAAKKKASKTPSTRFPPKSPPAAASRRDGAENGEEGVRARRRQASHSAGFYANVIFTGTPAIVAQLQNKFSLNEEVFRVLFTLSPEPETREVIAQPRRQSWPASTKSSLMGNLTRDPELRYTPKGTAIAKSAWPSTAWKSETGEMKEEVTFVDVDVWQNRRNHRPIPEEGPPDFD
jgi:hypothetical protein